MLEKLSLSLLSGKQMPKLPRSRVLDEIELKAYGLGDLVGDEPDEIGLDRAFKPTRNAFSSCVSERLQKRSILQLPQH